MEFKGPDYIYKCTPDVLDNRRSESPAVVHLKRLTQDQIEKGVIEEKEMHSTYNPSEAMAKIGQMVTERVRDKFVKVENLTIDGKAVETWDEFHSLAPPEMIQWVINAICSTYLLSEAELGN